jgi:hypothetical protein
MAGTLKKEFTSSSSSSSSSYGDGALEALLSDNDLYGDVPLLSFEAVIKDPLRISFSRADLFKHPVLPGFRGEPVFQPDDGTPEIFRDRDFYDQLRLNKPYALPKPAAA